MDKKYVRGMAPQAKPKKQPDRMQQYSSMQGIPPAQGTQLDVGSVEMNPQGLDLSIESMLAQALAARSSAKLDQAAAKDAAFNQQLAMRERTKVLDPRAAFNRNAEMLGGWQASQMSSRGHDTRQPVNAGRTQLDVGPVEVDGGTAHMGRHFDYRDMNAPPARHPVSGIQDASPVDGMPVFSKADSLGRQMHASNIAAMTERGQAAPSHMYQGLTPEDIVGALSMGGDMRAMGGPPSLSGAPSPADAPGKYGDGVYRGEQGWSPEIAVPSYRDPQQHGEALDAFVQKHGYVPEMFADKTPDEAMMMLARQLEAQRARNGDLSAWSTNI
jgi:hypothetical protein